MVDVARAAGVSPMTVSRALKRDSHVSDDTRKQVLKVVEKLGYVPDQIAGGLSSQRSGFVAALVPSFNNPHFADTVAGLTKRLQDIDLQVIVGYTEYRKEQEETLVASLLGRRPEAIVLTYDGHSKRTIDMLAASGLPVIQTWETPKEPIEHVVGFSNFDAARAMTEHLISNDHRQIVFLGEANDRETRGAERRRGYRAAIRRADEQEPCELAFAPPPISAEQGARALPEILERWPEVDAIFCVSDPCAFGVLSECMRRGVRVPKQIAIAGFGDFDLAPLSVPSITTVGVDAEGIGEKTGELIAELRDASKRGVRLSPQSITVHTSIVPRESTKR